MKIRYSILIFLLLIVFCLNVVVVKTETLEVYNDLYKSISKNPNFKVEETSFQIKFETFIEFGEISKSIDKIIKEDINLRTSYYTLKLDDKKIDFISDDLTLKASYVKDEKVLRLSIAVTNNRDINLYKYENLKKTLQNFAKDNDNFEDYKFNECIKLKSFKNDINDINNDFLKYVEEYYCIRDVDSLKINSGIAGNIAFTDDSKINYAICKYISGTYLYIGTPIITCIY